MRGHCLCGSVSFEVDPPVGACVTCHCESCRRQTSSPFTTYAGYAASDVSFEGIPLARHVSSPGVVRSFCPRCGTQLVFANDKQPGEIDITIASLDDPNAVPPRDHCYLDTRLDWVKLADGLPERKY